MAFYSPEFSQDESMAEINMTPLVDVMLVLLIIFIVTLPVIHQAIEVELPHASLQSPPVQPQHLGITLDASGTIHCEGQTLTLQELAGKFRAAAQQEPPPQLHLHADRHTDYDHVIQVMAAGHNAGLHNIALVTEAER